MAIQIRKAQRRKAKLRLGLAAPSGGGKTYSALMLAFGIGGKIGLVDTEHGSGDLYAHLGEYDVIGLQAPFTVAKYREAIHAFEEAEYDTIIIDSLSHAWAGDGGLLDKQGKIADRIGNSYTAWRNVTPEHNELVEAILQSPCHIIATMRSKQEYVLETNEKGKQVPKKVGMAPVQREGMEYEFTVMLDIDMTHTATPSKDRTSLFDGQFFKIDKSTGKKFLNWLNTGDAALPAEPRAAAPTALQDCLDDIAAASTVDAVNALRSAVDALDTDDRKVAFAAAKVRIAALKPAPVTAAQPAEPPQETAGAGEGPL
jgi:hypothetical protein